MKLVDTHCVLVGLFSFGMAGPAPALEVHTVGADGLSDFNTIQAAVDEAANGDVVLVRGGSYSGFTVDGKSLWIARLGTNNVGAGPVVVTNLAMDQRVVLSGLSISASSIFSPALHVLDNLGHVRVDDCGIYGRSRYPLERLDGGPGAVIEDSRAVTFANSRLFGGMGGLSWFSPGGNGGSALVSAHSTPAFYDCEIRGGGGGPVESGGPGGDGGPACHVLSRSVFVSGGAVTGGDGGGAHIKTGGEPGGDGGVGVIVEANAAMQLLGAPVSGGAGGVSFWGPDGVSGAASSGAGTLTELQETPRLLSAELVTSQSNLVELEIRGAPGDRVYFGTSMSPGFTLSPSALGYDLLAPNARFNLRPIGTIPEFVSTLKVQVPLLDIGAQPMRPLFGQAIVVDVYGRVVRSGPVHFLVANCAMIAPDCNGNGSWDHCDLTDGTSADSNGNDLADECEFTQITHVDASAPSGGDGSAAHPFQTIQRGVDASPDFQIVRVHDGVYTGPQNRNVNLSNRVLHVESANGPTNCILDLEDAGIAFAVLGLESTPCRIAGFTIRNGNGKAFPSEAFGGGIYVVSSDPRIENCTFENCTAEVAGAIYGASMNSRIAGCRFIGNHSPTGAGAVWLRAAFSPTVGAAEIVDCYFFGNVGGPNGGAVELIPSNGNEVRMSHCIVLANSATRGGGVAVGSQTSPDRAVRIEHCLIAGNTADIGGGVIFNHSGTSSPPKTLRNCTVVGNTATSHGGGVSSRIATIDNCVMWGNTAPLGAQLSALGGALTVRSSDAQGGQAAVHLLAGSSLVWGAGNIDMDPLFVDPDGLDDTLATLEDNDYRLGVGSPCIDAGDNAFVSNDFFDLDGDSITIEPVPFDLDFLTRIIGALVDMGAYEKQP